MKKILVAFDNAHFSEGAFEVARRINEIQPVFLTGLFLPAVYYANSSVGATEESQPFFIPLTESEDIEVINESIYRFEKLCNKNNIRYVVHTNPDDAAIPSLKLETRFSDLLILGSQRFYKNLGSLKPNAYLKYALHESECPVLLVPEKFDFPTSNILAYEGSDSAVYAIKQFKYVFAELCKQKTYLLYATEKNNDEIPHLAYIEELLNTAFDDFELKKLDVHPRKYIAQWINEIKGAILVTGSYGRSDFAEFFRKSFINEVISQHQIPIFIAHH